MIERPREHCSPSLAARRSNASFAVGHGPGPSCAGLAWKGFCRDRLRIMSETGTITRCIRDLESGESSRRNVAARELWEFFFADLMCYARRRLQAAQVSRGAADEEDAAERAFTKVCRAIERGRLKLGSRIDLRKVLRSAAAREVITLLHRGKREAGQTGDDFVLRQIPDAAMPAELLLLAFDACQRLLELLETDTLRQIAIWKLAGYTNESIRIQLGCSLATVERTLAHIRETWRRNWDVALADRPAKSGRRDSSDDHDPSLTADWLNGITAADANEILRGLAGLR